MIGVLEVLAEKYRELIALRRTAERDDARLRSLATRFPGAVRELDTRTMESLEGRLRELQAAIAGGKTPSWADTQLRFHGWLRVALRLRAEGVSDLAAARAWSISYAPSEPGDPPREALDDAALTQLVHPPNGRLSLGARALVARESEDLDALLFGPG